MSKESLCFEDCFRGITDAPPLGKTPSKKAVAKAAAKAAAKKAAKKAMFNRQINQVAKKSANGILELPISELLTAFKA